MSGLRFPRSASRVAPSPCLVGRSKRLPEEVALIDRVDSGSRGASRSPRGPEPVAFDALLTNVDDLVESEDLQYLAYLPGW